VALAAADKPVAFVLSIAFIAQLVVINAGKTRPEYLWAGGLILVPAICVALYAIIYMLAAIFRYVSQPALFERS